MRVEKSGNDLTEEVMGELEGVEGVEGGGEIMSIRMLGGSGGVPEKKMCRSWRRE